MNHKSISMDNKKYMVVLTDMQELSILIHVDFYNDHITYSYADDRGYSFRHDFESTDYEGICDVLDQIMNQIKTTYCDRCYLDPIIVANNEKVWIEFDKIKKIYEDQINYLHIDRLFVEQ